MPQNNIVEWNLTEDKPPVDGFEIKRRGNEPISCKILFYLESEPAQFKLSHELASLLGIHTSTKGSVLAALWQYIKKNRLQDAENPKVIRCDENLKKIFSCSLIQFSLVANLLAQHLSPPDPVIINYVIKVAPSQLPHYCYDIQIEVDDSLKSVLGSFLLSKEAQLELNNYNEKVDCLLQEISHARTRREFFLSYAKDPVQFIEKYISSQSRDMKIARDFLGNPETQRFSSYFRKPWVHEAVYRYLSTKVQERRLQLEQSLQNDRLTP
eukprot:Sdes_comp20519_c0_seq1m15102